MPTLEAEQVRIVGSSSNSYKCHNEARPLHVISVLMSSSTYFCQGTDSHSFISS